MAIETPSAPLSALRELVRLKDLHDLIEAIGFASIEEYRAAVVEYNRCKSKAWGAAREVLEIVPVQGTNGEWPWHPGLMCCCPECGLSGRRKP